VGTDFRKQITERLKRIGKTRYWLAEQLGGVPSSNAIYTYLNPRSRTDMTGEYIARILDAIEAEEKRQQG
jgi:hypothetical protein